jgi:pimeloyl-ACP methyl ester carboxylesterase
MASTKPTVVFIPGLWHTPEGFTSLATLLEKAAYPNILVDLPSAGAHPGHPDFSQDINAIRAIVSDLAGINKDIVLVMHSGGSISGSEALRSLSKKERMAAGNKGGVVALVYIGVLLPKAGTSMLETFYNTLQRPDLDPTFVVDTSQDYHVVAEVRIRCSSSCSIRRLILG